MTGSTKNQPNDPEQRKGENKNGAYSVIYEISYIDKRTSGAEHVAK